MKRHADYNGKLQIRVHSMIRHYDLKDQVTSASYDRSQSVALRFAGDYMEAISITVTDSEFLRRKRCTSHLCLDQTDQVVFHMAPSVLARPVRRIDSRLPAGRLQEPSAGA